ncbi:hypothetical protein Tco_1127023 [Tanacetum coccineum]
MTIAEYVEYEKKMNINHISNTKTYLHTYFSKRAPTHDPIREFANCFSPNQPGAESNCDSEDMEEEVEYITDDEVGLENLEDTLISIIKSIKKEMKDDIMKKKIEASTANIEDEPLKGVTWDLLTFFRIEHNNLHESDREFIFNECILDSYDVEEEYARGDGVIFKGLMANVAAWGARPDYDPPYVNIETFEVKKYSFKGGRSFICITDHEDKAVPLGRVNGARFKAMIRKELEGHKIKKLRGNSRDRLDSYSFGNLAEFAAGIKSLQDDGNKDFRPISNFKAMLREFLVLILPFLIISFP